MDISALVPDMPILSLEGIQEKENHTQSDTLGHDRILADLLMHKGYQHLESIFKDQIRMFHTGQFMGDTSQMSLEELGKKYVIASTIANFLQSIIDIPNNAAKAITEYERSERERSESIQEQPE